MGEQRGVDADGKIKSENQKTFAENDDEKNRLDRLEFKTNPENDTLRHDKAFIHRFHEEAHAGTPGVHL